MDLELIGRDDEPARLDAVVRQDPGSVAAIEGRAGVDKSHLVRRCATSAREGGWRVELAVATEAAATIPFGALGHLLPLPGPSAQQQFLHPDRRPTAFTRTRTVPRLVHWTIAVRNSPPGRVRETTRRWTSWQLRRPAGSVVDGGV